MSCAMQSELNPVRRVCGGGGRGVFECLEEQVKKQIVYDFQANQKEPMKVTSLTVYLRTK